MRWKRAAQKTCFVVYTQCLQSCSTQIWAANDDLTWNNISLDRLTNTCAKIPSEWGAVKRIRFGRLGSKGTRSNTPIAGQPSPTGCLLFLAVAFLKMTNTVTMLMKEVTGKMKIKFARICRKKKTSIAIVWFVKLSLKPVQDDQIKITNVHKWRECRLIPTETYSDANIHILSDCHLKPMEQRVMWLELNFNLFLI